MELKQKKILSSFPNVEISLRIFRVMNVTNCSGERSFSALKRVENKLKTSQSQERLSYLPLMNIESEILLPFRFFPSNL
nr:unnamed protein product [Callosobruchus analis]